MKKKYTVYSLSSLVIIFFAIMIVPVFAISENSLEPDAVDTVFQGASQSIIDQFPAGIAGPITSIVSFLETFRIQQYENALVKQSTLEVEYLESNESPSTSDDMTTEEESVESVSYADSVSEASFDVIFYKVKYTGWSLIIMMFKYWMLFYLISILVAVALVGKLYGILVRK
ncbi:MAG: hypothetical protein K9M36_03010 [Candidatus Pacebacteria bacterium]|nr:hypothetical protein [Candidatus Paceibacterota bacterium]